MGLGLAAFERQARTGLSGCLPEQFGIQFSKVLKDSKQTDPLDFCFAFTVWRSMETEQKVITWTFKSCTYIFETHFKMFNVRFHCFLNSSCIPYFVQKSVDGVDVKDYFNMMCDSFTRYIKLTYMLGIPACPTAVFCALLARPPNNRPGYNARDFVPSRVEVLSIVYTCFISRNVWCRPPPPPSVCSASL